MTCSRDLKPLFSLVPMKQNAMGREKEGRSKEEREEERRKGERKKGKEEGERKGGREKLVCDAPFRRNLLQIVYLYII